MATKAARRDEECRAAGRGAWSEVSQMVVLALRAGREEVFSTTLDKLGFDRCREETAKASTRANAGPSTPTFAKRANALARDDTSFRPRTGTDPWRKASEFSGRRRGLCRVLLS